MYFFQVERYGFENLNLEQCLQCLTQWLLVLREVLEDRGRMGLLGLARNDYDGGCTKCVCRKADSIVERLRNVEKRFTAVIESSGNVIERSGNVKECSRSVVKREAVYRSDLEKLWAVLDDVQETLRMNVSIQVKRNPLNVIT